MHNRAAMVTICLMLTLGAGAGMATGQIPDEYENLKVLRKEIAKGELIGVMREMASALGQRCAYCHVGPDNLQGMDFATDEKATKKAARLMMRMVHDINEGYVRKVVSDRPAIAEVTCATCHRRMEVPRLIKDVIAETIASDSVAAALKQYGELRDEYYGSAAYDFSEIPLNTVAEGLASSGKLDQAVTVIEANLAFHPDKPWTHISLAGIHAKRGDRDAAIASYEEALKLDPDNGWVKRQLAALREDS